LGSDTSTLTQHLTDGTCAVLLPPSSDHRAYLVVPETQEERFIRTLSGRPFMRMS